MLTMDNNEKGVLLQIGKQVTISIEEYTDLVVARYEVRMLLSALKNSASLNYSKTGLRFDDDALDVVLSLMTPFEYEDLINSLKAEEAEAEND